MPTAKTKAVRKYNEKSYDRIELKVAKGMKEPIKVHATKNGESLNGFINRAITETIGNDTILMKKSIQALFEGYKGEYELTDINWGTPVGRELW